MNNENVNNGNIISNVIWKFAERISAQLVSLIVSIVLARILLPDDYGIISMVTVFITIANTFVTNGIPSALIQKKDADSVDFSSVFFFNLIFSLVLYIILFFLSPVIAEFYKNDSLCLVTRIMSLRIIIAAINSVQHAYVSRTMQFKKYFWSTLFGTVFSGILGVTMAYCGFGVWALVGQYMSNTIIDTIILFITVKWRPTFEFSFSRLKVLFKFGWKILFEGLSNTIVGQLQNLIIGKAYTSSDLAFYTKGQQFPTLIVNNISVSISSVLFPAMSAKQDDKEMVLNLLRKSVRVSSYVVFPMLAGLAVVAKPFVALVLTEKWIDVVPYLQVFCLLSAPTVGMIPRHQALNGTGRSDVFMVEHIFARIVIIIVLLLTYKISILAIIIGSIISTLVLSITVAYTSNIYNGYRYVDQIRDIFPTCICTVIMCIPVYCVQLLSLSNIATLLIQIIVGVSVYIIVSKFFKMDELLVLQKYLKTIVKKQ